MIFRIIFSFMLVMIIAFVLKLIKDVIRDGDKDRHRDIRNDCLGLLAIVLIISSLYLIEFKLIDYSSAQLYDKAIILQNSAGSNSETLTRQVFDRLSIKYLEIAREKDPNNKNAIKLLKLLKAN